MGETSVIKTITSLLFISHEQVAELVLDTTKQSYCNYPFHRGNQRNASCIFGAVRCLSFKERDSLLYFEHYWECVQAHRFWWLYWVYWIYGITTGIVISPDWIIKCICTVRGNFSFCCDMWQGRNWGLCNKNQIITKKKGQIVFYPASRWRWSSIFEKTCHIPIWII